MVPFVLAFLFGTTTRPGEDFMPLLCYGVQSLNIQCPDISSVTPSPPGGAATTEELALNDLCYLHSSLRKISLSVIDPLRSGGRQLGPFLAWCYSCQLKETRFGKAERKLYSLIKEWGKERSCSKDLFSSKGGKQEAFKRSQVGAPSELRERGGDFLETAGACAGLWAPVHTALIVHSSASAPLGGGLSMIMRQRRLSHTSGLICAGAALMVRLEPIQVS